MADSGEGSDSGVSTDSGSTEAPMGVPGKFWDGESGSVNHEAWGKSYGELEGKLRTQKNELSKSMKAEWESERLSNRPESMDDYELNIPEHIQLPDDMEWSVAEDDPMMGWWRNLVFEQGGNQEMFDQGISMFLESQMANLPDIEAEMQELGDYGPQRAERVQMWAEKNLSEDSMAGLTDMMTSAKNLQVVEELMDKMGEAPFSPQDSAYAGMDLPDPIMIREKMNDPRYWDPLKRDAAYVREIEEMWQRHGEYEDKMQQK